MLEICPFGTTLEISAELRQALEDVSFEVKQGEFFGIVGRNGSGKSTLLKILAGIYQPNSGSVSVEGRVVPFIELGVGFNGELSGRDNVYLNGALFGFSVAEMDAMYNSIVDFAELSEFMDQKLKNYSSGMQVRLAFSLATRAKADVLLVDEVLAVGDGSFQRKCYDYFRQLKRSGTTVVFVTHDMDAVREYCDRAILVNDSRVAARGTADEIAAEYTKLFNEPEEEPTPEISTESRWGDKSIQYSDVVVKQTGGEHGSVTVSAIATVNQTLENPVFGFSLKNAAGVGVLGTNTKIRRQRIGDVLPGEHIRLSWTFDNILADGAYTVGLTAHHPDGVQTYDWWDEAAAFRVKKEEHTAFPITPEIKVELKRQDGNVGA